MNQVLHDVNEVDQIEKKVNPQIVSLEYGSHSLGAKCLADQRDEQLHADDVHHQLIHNVKGSSDVVVRGQFWLGPTNNHHHVIVNLGAQNLRALLIVILLLVEAINLMHTVQHRKHYDLSEDDTRKWDNQFNRVLN